MTETERGGLKRLASFARLFMTVPSSSISQERHFSELRRRNYGLRNRTSVETIDRDAVVYAWHSKDGNNVQSVRGQSSVLLN